MTSSHLSELDKTDLQILLLASDNRETGITSRDVERVLYLSRSAGLARFKNLKESGYLTRTSIPHRNPNMPPTYVHHLVETVSTTEIRLLLQQLESKTKAAMLHSTASTALPQSMSNVADLPLRLGQVFDQLSSTHRKDHLQILGLLLRGPKTSREIQLLLNWKKQSTHARLQQQRQEWGFIIREERSMGFGREYVYYLSPDLDQAELLALLEQENLQNIGEENPQSRVGSEILTPRTDVPIIAEVTNRMLVSDPPLSPVLSPNQPATTATESVSWAERILLTYPNFNPDWPLETQAEWLSSLNRLTRIVEGVL